MNNANVSGEEDWGGGENSLLLLAESPVFIKQRLRLNVKLNVGSLI